MTNNVEDDKSSIADTITTPAESVTADGTESQICNENVPPKPGSTYIIRSIKTNEVIKLSGGKVLLAPRDAHGSDEWTCFQGFNRWLGFCNRISGKMLGYDEHWNLRCEASMHLLWEWFRVRKRDEGGFVLIMSHLWRGLQPVGIKEEGGIKRPVMVKSWEADEAVWEFIEV